MKVKIQDEYLSILAEQPTGTGKQKFPLEVVIAFKRRISQLRELSNTKDLRALKSLHFEKLKESRYKDMHSVRLNKAYRLIIQIDKDDEMLEVVLVEEINKHYA